MLGVKKIPNSLLESHPEQFNVNNLHRYDPYYWISEKKTLVVDPIWFQTLLPEFQEKITTHFEKISFEHIDVPHNHPQTEEADWVYVTVNDMYDYHVWFKRTIPNAPSNVRMMRIDDSMKRVLEPICRRRSITGSKLNASDKEDLETIRDAIRLIMDTDVTYFVRLSCSSPKHNIPIRPINTADQVLDYITESPKYLQFEYTRTKPTFLVLIPWNNKLNKKFEFRLFIKDRKITCASQQEWYTSYGYTEQELVMIREALMNVPFLEELPYSDVVVDAWIDPETKSCNLIECNPWGTHCASGSALFHWEQDRDLIYGKASGELRILVSE